MSDRTETGFYMVTRCTGVASNGRRCSRRGVVALACAPAWLSRCRCHRLQARSLDPTRYEAELRAMREATDRIRAKLAAQRAERAARNVLPSSSPSTREVPTR